jgi:hypothetical protein
VFDEDEVFAVLDELLETLLDWELKNETIPGSVTATENLKTTREVLGDDGLRAMLRSKTVSPDIGPRAV